MSFEPGHTKFGGRKRGTPNKKSEKLDALLESLNFHPLKKLIETYEVLEPTKKAEICLNLLTYLYPRKKPVVSIEDIFDDHLSELTIEELNKEAEELHERNKKAMARIAMKEKGQIPTTD